MRDIVERLNTYRPQTEWGDGVHHTICSEAATLIEALRKERDEALAKAQLHQTDAAVAWKDIDTAPYDENFLAFGHYWYPGDKNPTIYQEIAWRSGNPDWPFEDAEGQHPDGFFSHWMHLPPPPALAQPVDSGNNGGET